MRQGQGSEGFATSSTIAHQLGVVSSGRRWYFMVLLRAPQSSQKLSSPSDRLATSASPSRLSRISTGRADGAASSNGGRSSADNGAGNGVSGGPDRSSGSFTGGVQQSSNSRTSLRAGSASSVTSVGSGGGNGSFTRQHRRSGSRHSEHRDVPGAAQLSPAAAQVGCVFS